jgi:hypothetical protein
MVEVEIIEEMEIVDDIIMIIIIMKKNGKNKEEI